MKKIFSIILLLSLVIGIAGCSSATTTPKSESEMEAKEQEQEIATSTQNEHAQKPDIYNMDSVYEFIKSNYSQYTQEDMDKWTVQYLDVTGDNVDEVLFTTTYGDGKLQSAIVITAEEGGYREISRNIPLAKYENAMEMRDGFLVHTTKIGGTGAYQYYMNLYSYDGTYLIAARQDIKIKEIVNALSENYEITSNIDGNLKDFTITYTKKDLDTEKEEIISKDRYIFNDSYKIDKTPISLSNIDYNNQDTGASSAAHTQSKTAFYSETINGEHINYDDYTIVVVPRYSGNNLDSLGNKTVRVVEDGEIVTFAVFGTLRNVTMFNILNMGEEGTPKHVGDISDSNVTIICSLPSDTSALKVRGFARVGQEEQIIEFTIDDVREKSEYNIIKY
ncbi:MAG: hypothetical protein FH758_10160 [Firmicutes bacterium]|nr:hypothetical protein [Bacillota bacterium]